MGESNNAIFFCGNIREKENDDDGVDSDMQFSKFALRQRNKKMLEKEKSLEKRVSQLEEKEKMVDK